MPHLPSNYEGLKIHLHKRNGGKYMTTWENVDENISTETFAHRFFEEFNFYPERQQWNVGSIGGPRLKDDIKISDQISHKEVAMYFKDLGIQISWRLVFVIEYMGPLIIFPMFVLFPQLIYFENRDQPLCLVQKLALWLTIAHYLKREVETLFIHRFSKATMPIVRLPINCLHYWVFNGVAIGYFLFHPRYQTASWITDPVAYVLSITMLVFEVLNLCTHITLKNLRPRGSTTRGIPHGWGFGVVSCANYWWESCAWFCFAILTNCFTSWVFFIVASGQMLEWALKKHANYKKEFKDEYPENRKAIIPFIL
eukprot:GHVH01013498.1.p1 GENE.GHVH01013498.1~~GHVH01013498.1.p1  ORF type:complete len:335 (+),score=39.14 GHVH01013498.1:74-1006(+)